MEIKGLDFLLPPGVTIETSGGEYDPRQPFKRWKDPQQAGKSLAPYTFLNFDENGAEDVKRDVHGRPEFFIGYIPGNQAAATNIPPAGAAVGNQTEIPIPRRMLNDNEDIQRTVVGFQVWITQPGEQAPLTPDQINATIAKIEAGIEQIITILKGRSGS